MAKIFEAIGKDEYTTDELEFLRAVDRYKLTHRRPFPDCREILAIAKSLGYRKEPYDPFLPEDLLLLIRENEPTNCS